MPGFSENQIEMNVSDFCLGIYNHNLDVEIWNPVFKYIASHYDTLKFNKEKIHSLWTVNGGHLRRKIADDDLVLSVLIRCLPGYDGESMTLFRGECNFLYEDNKIGFCWTPKIEIARMFARGLNSIESGGVLLKAYAPAKAILTAPNEHSAVTLDEHEYTCNPNLLENITVIEKYDNKK